MCFTQRDYFQVQFQIPKVVKRPRLFQQLSKYQGKQILCKKVIQVIKMNCEGNTTWLTMRDWPETGDLIDLQQCTYIITYTDHQMFLDLRTSQTEPTGTLYGSWERKCLKFWVWSPFSVKRDSSTLKGVVSHAVEGVRVRSQKTLHNVTNPLSSR